METRIYAAPAVKLLIANTALTLTHVCLLFVHRLRRWPINDLTLDPRGVCMLHAAWAYLDLRLDILFDLYRCQHGPYHMISLSIYNIISKYDYYYIHNNQKENQR